MELRERGSSDVYIGVNKSVVQVVGSLFVSSGENDPVIAMSTGVVSISGRESCEVDLDVGSKTKRGKVMHNGTFLILETGIEGNRVLVGSESGIVVIGGRDRVIVDGDWTEILHKVRLGNGSNWDVTYDPGTSVLWGGESGLSLDFHEGRIVGKRSEELRMEGVRAVVLSSHEGFGVIEGVNHRRLIGRDISSGAIDPMIVDLSNGTITVSV